MCREQKRRLARMFDTLRIICCLTGLAVTVNSQTLECAADQKKIDSVYHYDDQSRDCAELISKIIDPYHPGFISDCKRWIGDHHPERIHDYYIKYCQPLTDGRLRYEADICCDATLEMRCFECANFTFNQDQHCMDTAAARTCADGQICETRAKFYGSLFTWGTRTTGCADANTCLAAQANNANTCIHWSLDPTCTYCCNLAFCNYDPPYAGWKYVGDDACLSNPCYYGGTCVPSDPPRSGYTCNCTVGYTGSRCQIAPSIENPCQNGASFVRGTPYTCRCRQGWGGQNCSEAYPLCSANNLCQNHGSCIDHGSYGLRCNCTEGFVGAQCEKKSTLTCQDSIFYHRYGNYFTYFGSDNCTSRLQRNELSRRTGLVNTCAHRMAQPGKPVFQNHIHGYVDKIPAYSYRKCAKGETYGYYEDQMCCASCQSMPCENGAWCVQDKNDDYVCKCRYGWYGRNCDIQRKLCLISGDPHHRTFDGELISFQGRVSYILSSSTATLNKTFKVVGTNQKIGAVSYLRSMMVEVCGHTILLDRNFVKIDGFRQNKDARIDVNDVQGNPCFTYLPNGNSMRVETRYNLIVEYDGIWTGFIQVPPDFAGNIEGLCGNYDDDPTTDYIGQDGTNYVNDMNRSFRVGNSWNVISNGRKRNAPDEPFVLPNCTDIMDVIDSDQYCGLLLDDSGPFAACLTDDAVNTDDDVEVCRYDVCANSGVPEDMKSTACNALHAMTVKCEAEGYSLIWREEAGCPLDCPTGLVYMERTSACPATCQIPDAASTCHLPDTEACVCPDGLLRHNGTCVDPSTCDCVDNFGNSFKVGELWLSGDCTTVYSCDECSDCAKPAVINQRPGDPIHLEQCVQTGFGVVSVPEDTLPWSPWRQCPQCGGCGNGTRSRVRIDGTLETETGQCPPERCVRNRHSPRESIKVPGRRRRILRARRCCWTWKWNPDQPSQYPQKPCYHRLVKGWKDP